MKIFPNKTFPNSMNNPQKLTVWEKLMVKSALARRVSEFFWKIPRTFIRLKAKPVDFIYAPPVIVNSVPKSGTNLLVQIAEAMPNKRNYGTLWTNIPSWSYKEYSKRIMLDMIGSTVPGEIVVTHLFYKPEYHSALNKKKLCIFLSIVTPETL